MRINQNQPEHRKPHPSEKQRDRQRQHSLGPRPARRGQSVIGSRSRPRKNRSRRNTTAQHNGSHGIAREPSPAMAILCKPAMLIEVLATEHARIPSRCVLVIESLYWCIIACIAGRSITTFQSLPKRWKFKFSVCAGADAI